MKSAPIPAMANPRVRIRSVLVDLSSRSDAPARGGLGFAEHGRCDAGWQVAAAQRGDEPVHGPVALTLNALDGEDHPGAPDLRVQTTGV